MTSGEETLSFYYLLGSAISAWANVERALCGVVSTCFTKHNTTLAIIAFFSIDNFRTKLQTANHLFTTKFDGTKYVAEWEKIVPSLERLAILRNHLAHYHTVGYQHEPPGRRLALVPVIGKIPKFRQRVPKPPPGSLCLREIAHARRQFEAVGYALDFLFWRVTKQRTQLPASLAQAGDALTMAELTRLMRAILYRQPPP